MVDYNLLSAAVSAAICVRIMLYRRGQATYRPLVSLIAYLMAMATGCYSLTIVLHELAGPPMQANPFTLVVLVILAWLVFRARGNISRVIRVHWDKQP